MNFKHVSPYEPRGDQPQAIRELVKGFKSGKHKQVLLGVTGSGKTFTMSKVIEQLGKPTLVLAHNKTLAAQLFSELKAYFPKNRVEYFVSYYDYYQPEAYLPKSDTYIEKDLAINPKIEQMRLSATQALLTRKDVIIVASVSCIYGLGDPKNYELMAFEMRKGNTIPRRDLILRLLDQQYERNDTELVPGRFRVKGHVIDVVPGYEEDIVRVELFGDEIDRISIIDRQTGQLKDRREYYYLFPARHFVADEKTRDKAIASIQQELEEVLPTIEDPFVKHRLMTRVKYDLELIKEIGHCKGIENYSRHFDNRKPGVRPFCLLDYIPEDFLLIIDESHQTIPQVHGMYNGDRSRKQALVDYGFRLPCAFDNRPLKFAEFEDFMRNVLFVSATPAQYEVKIADQVVEQIIRPTGLLDPVVDHHPIEGQMTHLLDEIAQIRSKQGKTLVTTLTKRLAEELTEFLANRGVRVRYLHSEIDTLERTEIIRQLRADVFDVLVGINLLREGLDIPEVQLVAILDADKEGFLRNERSLIQTIGRAARNADAKVVLYYDRETESIRRAVSETARRRRLQMAFNKRHSIVPQTITKPVPESEIEVKDIKHIPKRAIPQTIMELEEKMNKAADDLNFELAILLRDRIARLKKKGA
ncbi:excinuclease ABC subunit UvrB [Candidatus Woesearchaeota archaeon]|nr:excinuclease ABC subunit UvrB [Candidatus Woesearchaeota archaeon]